MRKGIRFTGFVLIFTLCLIGVMEPMSHFNSRTEAYKNLYTNADVLIIGSSHAYCNLDAATMWEEYGISSVSLAQGEQPFNMTYYTLVEALRYRVPKLVVVESYMDFGSTLGYAERTDKYVDALLSFPFYKNFDLRIDAVKRIDTPYKLPYVLGFPYWHNHYGQEIEIERTAGFSYLFNCNEGDQWDTRCSSGKIEEALPLGEENIYYLQKIIDCCDKKQIPVLILLTPYQMNEEHAGYAKALGEYCMQHGIDFLDMNNYSSEIGINLSDEMHDWGHTIVSATEKNSVYLGKYICDNYDIIDRRGDIAYEAWDEVYNGYIEEKKSYLHHGDFSDCMRILRNDRNLSCLIWADDGGKELLDSAGIPIKATWIEDQEQVSTYLGDTNGYQVAIVAVDQDGNAFTTARWRVEEDNIVNIDP